MLGFANIVFFKDHMQHNNKHPCLRPTHQELVSVIKHWHVTFQEIVHLLQQTQTEENALFKAAQATAAQRSQTPQAPVVLMRSPTSMTLTHRPFRLKTQAKPAFFAVFAKSFGAGVGLGMNSTSMELEGTGVQQPLGARVIVAGTAPALQSCKAGPT